jgi:hypothetical protein
LLWLRVFSAVSQLLSHRVFAVLEFLLSNQNISNPNQFLEEQKEQFFRIFKLPPSNSSSSNRHFSTTQSKARGIPQSTQEATNKANNQRANEGTKQRANEGTKQRANEGTKQASKQRALPSRSSTHTKARPLGDRHTPLYSVLST